MHVCETPEYLQMPVGHLLTRPCIFLGYGDDEFGYRVWDPVDKKVFRSRDIIFMEDKTLADWESEKKIKNSEEIRSKPTESRLTLEEPAGFPESGHYLHGGQDSCRLGVGEEDNELR